MFSVIVVSHGHIAKALSEAFCAMVSCKFPLSCFCTDEDMELDEIEKKIENVIMEKLTWGDVVVLTDLKLGTPFNIIMHLMKKYPIIHLTGMNFPLLLHLNSNYVHDGDSKEICEIALEEAKKDLMNMEELKRRADCGNCLIKSG